MSYIWKGVVTHCNILGPPRKGRLNLYMFQVLLLFPLVNVLGVKMSEEHVS